MKSIKILFATLIAILGLTTFTSCSDDDNNEPNMPAAKAIEGSYKGDMECSVMGDASTFENMTFTISATDDATVTVTLPAFGKAPMALPSITLTGIKVSEKDGVATQPAVWCNAHAYDLFFLRNKTVKQHKDSKRI